MSSPNQKLENNESSERGFESFKHGQLFLNLNLKHMVQFLKIDISSLGTGKIKE